MKYGFKISENVRLVYKNIHFYTLKKSFNPVFLKNFRLIMNFTSLLLH